MEIERNRKDPETPDRTLRYKRRYSVNSFENITTSPCPLSFSSQFLFFFFLVQPSCALHLDRSPLLSLSPHTDDMLHVGKIHTQVSRVEKGRDHRSNIYIYIYFSFLYIRARVMYLQETREATSIRLRDYMYTYVYYIELL